MFGRKKKQKHAAPDTSVRVHESGYIMRTGENLVLAQEATSPEGNGWLLATNKALFFIHHQRGIYLYLDQDMITSLKNDKGKITVKWLEKGQGFEFSMRLKDGYYTTDDAVNTLNTRFQYAGQAFEHVELTEKEVAEARKERIRIYEKELKKTQDIITRVENDDFPKDEKDRLDSLRMIEITDKENLEYVKTMPFVRSAKVPSHIPLHFVWNDCYYDKEKATFITFRKFRDGLGPKTLAGQKKLNPSGEGVAFDWRDIRFLYSYPTVVGKTKDGNYKASLLCTLSEEMITNELVIRLYAAQRGMEKNDWVDKTDVYYETEAPRRIGGKFFKLTEKEREIGLKYLPWLVFTNNPDIPWIKPYKIIQFDKEQAVKP